MPYFKKDKIVVKSKTAPLCFADGELKAIFNGWVVPFCKTPAHVEPEGILIDNGIPWDKATEMEYLIYQSLALKLEALACRETRSKMWALNNANATDLKLGVNFVEDKEPVRITSIADKATMISLTQHGASPDLPSLTKHKNSVWTTWIINKRKQEPFIYLGEAVNMIEGS